MTNASTQISLNEFWDKLGIPCVTLNQAADQVIWCMKCGIVPNLIGEGGIGKTQIYAQIAEDLGYRVEYLFLAHLEREDLIGIPYPQNGDGVYKFLVEDKLKSIISNSDKPVILVLDEWNRGEKEVMGAAFTMMEHRRYGSIDLPDHVHIAAAMNPSEGAYLVNECEKDPAFRRRLSFIGVRADSAAWLAHAKGRGAYHSLVVRYIERNPMAILDVHARDAGKVYCNPAALEKLSNLLYQMDKERFDYRSNISMFRNLVAGFLGIGTATEFGTWLVNEDTLIDPREVMLHYSRARDGVLRIVEDGMAPQINTLCQAVANICVTEELLGDNEIANLGKFYLDLKHSDFRSTLTEAIYLAGETLRKKEYFSRLNIKISQNQDYLAAHNAILNGREQVRQEFKG